MFSGVYLRVQKVDQESIAETPAVIDSAEFGIADLTVEKKILAPREADLGKDKEYKELLLHILQSHEWSEDELNSLRGYLADPRAEFLYRTMAKNAKHTETKDLYDHNTTNESINACISFWKKHKGQISTATRDFSVPSSVIVAIMKIETNLGADTEKHSIFNVFWSLTVSDQSEVLADLYDLSALTPDEKRQLARRAKWGRRELRDLLYMAHNGGKDPLELKGSWAGAFGISQFLPTSYRAYGHDGNSDGVVDLDNISDAAASIANYLESNGWRNNLNLYRKKKVIMTYNISRPYADCVISLSDSIEARLKAEEN